MRPMMITRYYMATNVIEDPDSTVLQAAAELCGGYSLTFMQGGWLDRRGELVTEDSVCLEVVIDADPNLMTLDEIVLRQARSVGEEAVLVVSLPCNGMMMYTDEEI